MSQQDIQTEFEDILKQSSWWRRFIGSQFVAGFALFISQIVYRCEQFARRRLQESFLSKATKESSILAAAEDRAFVGRKISPSTGTVTVTNNDTDRLSLPLNTPLVSKEQVSYLTMNAVELMPGQSVDVPISQLVKNRITRTVESAQKWQKVLLSREMTAKAHRVDVYVNGELWEKRFKFRNTTGQSKAYMEYYKPSRQLGIRFGNNLNGKIPEMGDIIELVVWSTEGETTLINNQPLTLIDDLAELNKDVTITTKTPITGGAEGDSIEDIRNGALYSTSYDHQLAWDGDYMQFIKDNVGGIIWLSLWGEKEEEKITGVKDLRNMNKIFISAYSDRKDDVKLQAEIETLFSGRDGYNEIYEWRNRVDSPFTLAITGKVEVNGRPEDAELYLAEKLAAKYGKDIKDKPHRVLLDDVWGFIRTLKRDAFIKEFKVTAENLPDKVTVGHYSYLDIDASTITFTY